MKLSPSVIDAMLSSGCSAEQIAAAVKAAMRLDDESVAERKEKDRIRKREERAEKKNNKNNDGVQSVQRTPADISDTPSPDKEKSPKPPKEINPIPTSELRSASAPDVRDMLWSEGVASIKRQTGKTEGTIRSLVGRWCRDTRDDCRIVLSAIKQAEADRVGDPIAWVTKAIAKQQAPPTLTPFQQRHQTAIDAFDRKIGTTRNDEFASDIIDVEPADWRAH